MAARPRLFASMSEAVGSVRTSSLEMQIGLTAAQNGSAVATMLGAQPLNSAGTASRLASFSSFLT